MGPLMPPVLNFWCCLPQASKPGWIPFCLLSCLCDPQIHLWFDTCWLYGGKHGSWTFFIHVLTDMSTSIGGGLTWGSNPPPSVRWAQHCKPLGHSGSTGACKISYEKFLRRNHLLRSCEFSQKFTTVDVLIWNIIFNGRHIHNLFEQTISKLARIYILFTNTTYVKISELVHFWLFLESSMPNLTYRNLCVNK